MARSFRLQPEVTSCLPPFGVRLSLTEARLGDFVHQVDKRCCHKIVAQMDAFRRIARRLGWIIVPVGMLLTIVGFHGQPALWVPLVVIFVVAWIMGARSDRMAQSRQRKR